MAKDELKTGTVHHEAPDTGATCCVYPKGEVRYSTDWREVTCSACISFRPKGVSVTETSVTTTGDDLAEQFEKGWRAGYREALERARRELIDLFAKRTVDSDFSWRGDYMEGLDDAIKRVAGMSGDTSHD